MSIIAVNQDNNNKSISDFNNWSDNEHFKLTRMGYDCLLLQKHGVTDSNLTVDEQAILGLFMGYMPLDIGYFKLMVSFSKSGSIPRQLNFEAEKVPTILESLLNKKYIRKLTDYEQKILDINLENQYQGYEYASEEEDYEQIQIKTAAKKIPSKDTKVVEAAATASTTDQEDNVFRYVIENYPICFEKDKAFIVHAMARNFLRKVMAKHRPDQDYSNAFSTKEVINVECDFCRKSLGWNENIQVCILCEKTFDICPNCSKIRQEQKEEEICFRHQDTNTKDPKTTIRFEYHETIEGFGIKLVH